MQVILFQGLPNTAASSDLRQKCAHFPDRMIYLEGSDDIFSIIYFEGSDEIFLTIYLEGSDDIFSIMYLDTGELRCCISNNSIGGLR